MGSLDDDLTWLAAHYDALARAHGDAPAASQWSSRATQDTRLAVLAEIGVGPDDSVLDVGCGTGALLDLLYAERRYRGDYLGVDLSEAALALGRARHPNARFERTNVLDPSFAAAGPSAARFDWILMSGLLNNRVSDNVGFARALLDATLPRAKKGVALNALSTYVDYQDDGLYYFDPTVLFRLCKERCARVVLRHDYLIKAGVIPFEFTIYLITAP